MKDHFTSFREVRKEKQFFDYMKPYLGITNKTKVCY